MKLSFYSPIVAALLGLLLLNAPSVVSPLSAETATAPAKVKKIPFHGKLESIDATAQTITLSGKSARVFHLTPDTRITDGAGQPSTLTSAVVGEDVGGSYTKDSAGTMTLFSVRFGAKTGSKAASSEATATPAATPAPVAAAAPAAPAATKPTAPAAAEPTADAAPAAATATAKAKSQRFSGKVVSIDIIAHTLVVHGKADQTFTVSSATKYTGVDGLSSVTAGEKVSGSYMKSADGATNTVSTLKVTPAK